MSVKDETVWLSLDQMCKLFDRDKSVISRHIKNALNEELDNSTVANFATVQSEGNKKVKRNITYYNLDMIISVGYRVKSKNGIIFRKWATKVLKEHLIKGYTVNQKRLEYLEKTVKLVDIAGRIGTNLNGEEAKEIISIINNYSKGLNLLDDYDHGKINKPKGNKSNKKITYEECLDVIGTLKFNDKNDLFGLERSNGLKSIISNIYQTFDGKELYYSTEEKAANLLYLITKNHVFIDGNKRIAATLFLYFLSYYDILYRNGNQIIDNNTLVAVTLLIAESNPKEKNVLVDLVMNFLTT